ncbi:hypothetical protein PIROE2DRAFT_62615 [Piromyces sp. E2]|nr:hypothetical protein PIROE2DRAFT_62615 [Piromyces sp. E2]|eukprot:OUM61268.1 hypothetical protein PIROE2DRAFT_62615 [Piromyces sp. E2]
MIEEEVPPDLTKEYFDNMEENIPDNQTITTDNKNAYGGNSTIYNYNKRNPGATMLKSSDKAYKELKEETQNIRKENEDFRKELQNMLNSFSEQITTQMNLLTTTLSNVIHENKVDSDNKFKKIQFELANKAENVAFQDLANHINENTVKPNQLIETFDNLNINMALIQHNTVRNEDILPLEAAATSNNEAIIQSNQEIKNLTDQINIITNKLEQLNSDIINNNTYTTNITKEIVNEMNEKLSSIRNDVKINLSNLDSKLNQYNQ